MTGLLLAALRPQIAKQLVAAHATLPRRSEERKQGQGPPLGGRPQRRPGIAVHSETPQSSQPQRARRHVRGSTLVGPVVYTRPRSVEEQANPAASAPRNPFPVPA